MIKHGAVLLMILAGMAVPLAAQAIDQGQLAHEQARRAQAQGTVSAPPVTVPVQSSASPRFDQGGRYHQQIVTQQRKGQPIKAVKPTH